MEPLVFWVNAEPAVVFAGAEVFGLLSCLLATEATRADVVSFDFFAGMFTPRNRFTECDCSYEYRRLQRYLAPMLANIQAVRCDRMSQGDGRGESNKKARSG